MYEKFTLTIETSNAAMELRYDVAKALREVADKIETGQDGGTIRDENGNTVGRYEWN